MSEFWEDAPLQVKGMPGRTPNTERNNERCKSGEDSREVFKRITVLEERLKDWGGTMVTWVTWEKERVMNQRKHMRVPISGVATVAFQGEEGLHSVQALTGNMSFAGIGLYSDNPIRKETTVLTTINYLSMGGAMEKAVIDGYVVYNKIIGRLHYIGIQFAEEINRTNQPSLYENIERRLRHQ
jgi:hypothetical protein